MTPGRGSARHLSVAGPGRRAHEGWVRACRLMATVAILAAAGCETDQITVAPTSPDSGVVPDAGFPDAGFPDAGFPDAGEPPPAAELVYIHTGDTLSAFDPLDGTVTRIGAFRDSNGPIERMVDIAIDLDGRMFGGTSERKIVQIDPSNGFCTERFTFDDTLHGMTFVSDGRLVVAGERVTIVDVDSGRALSELSGARRYETSGDVVGLPDGMLYWTVRNSTPEDGDGVVRLDPNTGRTTWLGAARISKLYGLGYANGELLGFSDEGMVVRLDATTGRVLDVSTLEGRWWGATTNPVRW